MTWIGIGVGSTIGGLIPSLWGADIFSISSIIWSGIGAMAGIWIGYQLNHW
jgi:hypothetical protein